MTQAGTATARPSKPTRVACHPNTLPTIVRQGAAGHPPRGEGNKAIARALDISHDTVKLHVRHILAQLNLSSRVEPAVFAVAARSDPEAMR